MREVFPKFRYAHMEGDKLWFVPYRVSALFEYDLTKEKAFFFEFLSIKDEDSRRFHLMEKKGNTLILAPYKGNAFYTFDILQHTASRICMDDDRQGMFMSACHVGESVYFISRNPILAKMDVENKAVKLFHSYQKEEIYRNEEKKEFWSGGSGCIGKNGLMIPNLQNSKIVQWDTDTDQYSSIDLEMDRVMIRDIIYINSKYWMLPRYGTTVYAWDENAHAITKVRNECGAKFDWHSHFCSDGRNIMIVDDWCAHIYKIDPERMRIDEALYAAHMQDFHYGNNSNIMRVRWAECHDGRLYLNLMDEDQLIEYDISTERLRLLDLGLVNKKEYFQMLGEHYDVIAETMPYCSMDSMVNADLCAVMNDKAVNCVGEKIFKIMTE